MLKEILVPDIGSFSNVEIIEIAVSPGDAVQIDTGLMTLETDKATVEIPSPCAGIVKLVHVAVGDKVSEGHLIVSIEEVADNVEPIKKFEPESKKTAETIRETQVVGVKSDVALPSASLTLTPVGREDDSHKKQAAVSHTDVKGIPHASPGIRRFARELGADLFRINASGPKNRILKTDIQAYVKAELAKTQSGGYVGNSGATNIAHFTVAPPSFVDFAKFGEIEIQPLPRIKKLSGSFLHRNWVTVPHVTQFDEADITELENFRKEQQGLAEQQGVKLTPLVFMMKAVATALKSFPHFNASLDASGSSLVVKKYFHIGVAVDTPHGLVVPVVRDVDQKGLFQLAKELGEISHRARLGQLSGQDMQGSCFSISSLGGIGGTAFTPIINVPDVAILGVSKAQIKPVYLEGEFKPRLLLPLSLSYDHRVIDGAEGARFMVYLVKQLSDIRRLLL